MRCRAWCLVFSFASCFLWAAQPAAALGLGGYVSGAAGDANGDARASHGGVGFSLDTGIGRDRVFRYRLQAGYEHVHLSGDPTVDGDLDGLITDHHFGFRLARGPAATLWAGPQIRVSWYGGENAAGPAFGIGAGVGIDMPISPTLTVSVVGGYRQLLHVHLWDDLYERLWYVDLAFLWGRGGP